MANLEEEIIRAGRAKELLENPLLLGAFEAIEANLKDAWKQSNMRDVEGREYVFLAMKVLEQLKGALTEHVQTGMLAKMQLSNLQGNRSNELH